MRSPAYVFSTLDDEPIAPTQCKLSPELVEKSDDKDEEVLNKSDYGNFALLVMLCKLVII